MIKVIHPVKSNQVIELNRGNPVSLSYCMPNGQQFLYGSDSYLTFFNAAGQAIDSWQADTVNGKLCFHAPSTSTDAIPAGSSWTLVSDYGGDEVRMIEQGTVIRAEAPFPAAPGMSPNTQAVSYSYSFATPGLISDPSWVLLDGHPNVYDNSLFSLPNAVAAGSLLSGDLAVYDQVFMLYYAPLQTDNVRVTYQTVANSGWDGDAWIALSCNYDASNFAAIHHVQEPFNNYIAIAVGSGPTDITDVTSHVFHVTAHETFTGEYNASSGVYSVYLGTDTTPIVSWENSGEVDIGPGDRYVGMGFKSSLLSPGVEICNWFAADDIGIG